VSCRAEATITVFGVTAYEKLRKGLIFWFNRDEKQSIHPKLLGKPS